MHLFLRNHDAIPPTTLAPDHRQRFLHAIDPEFRFRFNGGVALRLMNTCECSPTHRASDPQQRKQSGRECFQNILEKLLSFPAPIVLYYGDELGIKNVPLAAGVRDARAYVRNIFDWDEAERQKNDSKSMLAYVKKLAADRANR